MLVAAYDPGFLGGNPVFIHHKPDVGQVLLFHQLQEEPSPFIISYDRTEDGQGYGAVEEGLIVLIPL